MTTISIIFLTACVIWWLVGVTAWIYTEHIIRRKIPRPIGRFDIYLFFIFSLCGPVSWFFAILIKEISELE